MTAFLLALCLTSATTGLLSNERRLIRRDRAFVVANSPRTTSSLSRLYCQRRWRCHPALHRKNKRLFLASSVHPAFSSSFSSSTAHSLGFLDRTASTLRRHISERKTGPAADKDRRISPLDRATVEHLFELSSGVMAGSLPRAAPQSRPRARNREGIVSVAAAASKAAESSTSTSSISSTPAPVAMPHSSGAMPPPPLSLSTSAMPMPANAANVGDADQDDDLDTRPSRSASIASRSNRLSLTLPIALPTSFPSRPVPTSATVASFPSTPVDISSVLASPSDPADIITAIAAQERRVLELREDLLRAEAGLSKLKRQWQTYEVQRKRAEIRRTEPLRQISTKLAAAGAAAAASAGPATPIGLVSMAASDFPSSDSSDSAETKGSGELDRRKALLLTQQTGSVPSTPPQTKRRVFTGRHTRALSLLSPTKTAVSDGFSIHEDQADDDERLTKSPASAHEPDSPFYQNLGRYAPKTAVQLSKRATWAAQSDHQTTGLKQVAGDLTATLWTFVEDLRQATMGDEPTQRGTLSSTRSGDLSSRADFFGDEDQQNTIRASTNGSTRPNLAKAFAVDATPTPASRNASLNDQGSKDGSGAMSAGNSNSKTQLSRSNSKKSNKRFSWTPLTVESYDDSEWSSWDSPTVKSPRWSGSTMNGDVSAIPEQADENTTSLNNAMVSSPTSPSASKANDIAWPAALNRLTPGNIKRTATDLMKEWEKSLTMPLETAGAQDVASSTRT